MKRATLILCILNVISVVCLTNTLYAQTKIYSDSYPMGIVCDTFIAKSKKYLLRPIKNPDIEIVIPIEGKKAVLNRGSMIRLTEKRSHHWKDLSMPISPETGAVESRGVLI